MNSIPLFGNHSRGTFRQNGFNSGFPEGSASHPMDECIASEATRNSPFTCLPKQVSNWLQMLRPRFRSRHPMVCWVLVCQTVYWGRAIIKGWVRLAPRHFAR